MVHNISWYHMPMSMLRVIFDHLSIFSCFTPTFFTPKKFESDLNRLILIPETTRDFLDDSESTGIWVRYFIFKNDFARARQSYPSEFQKCLIGVHIRISPRGDATDLKFCMVILETQVHNICKIQTSSILLTVFIKMAYMAYTNVFENFENQYLYRKIVFFSKFFPS